jgi:hypothetical protein
MFLYLKINLDLQLKINLHLKFHFFQEKTKEYDTILTTLAQISWSFKLPVCQVKG